MNIVRYTYPNRSVSPSYVFNRNPWNGLEREIDRMFENVLADFVVPSASENRFPVDLYDDKENTYIRADIPGVDRKDLNVEIVNGQLTISARRQSEAKEGATSESFSFSRTITLPDEVQADKVNATYENGILTVTVPKKEEVKAKKVTISVS